MSDDTAVPPPLQGRSLHPLITFAIKTALVMAAVTISLVILTDNLIGDVGNLVTSHTNLGGRAFWAKVERQLDKAAAPENELSPERQEKLLNDIHILADRARPFILEAQSAFSAQPEPGTPDQPEPPPPEK